MGFGGGALIASPLTNQLLAAFGGSGATPDVNGIAQTFLVMGLIYAVFMSVGWLLIRVPAAGLAARRLGPGAGQDRHADHHGERLGRATRSAPRSSGCSGWCCASTSPRASASWSGPRRSTPDFFPDATSPQALAAAAAGFVAMLSLANSRGPDPVVVDVGLPRPQEHVPDLPRRRRAALPRAHAADEHEQGAVPAHRDPAPVVLRRRASRRSRPTCATCSAPTRSGPSTGACSPPGPRPVCSGR